MITYVKERHCNPKASYWNNYLPYGVTAIYAQLICLSVVSFLIEKQRISNYGVLLISDIKFFCFPFLIWWIRKLRLLGFTTKKMNQLHWNGSEQEIILHCFSWPLIYTHYINYLVIVYLYACIGNSHVVSNPTWSWNTTVATTKVVLLLSKVIHICT